MAGPSESQAEEKTRSEWIFNPMRKIDWKKAAVLALVLLAPALPIGCGEPEGSAGGVGKKLDNALDPRGPAQKAGDKIDNAVGK